MNDYAKPETKNINQSVLKAMFFWVIGTGIFAVVEFLVAIGLYSQELKYLDKMIIGILIYLIIGCLIGALLGCITALFAKSFNKNNVNLDAFYMASNISSIILVWGALWAWDVFSIGGLKNIINYLAGMGLMAMLYIFVCFLYNLFKNCQDRKKLVRYFISISFSIYTFIGIGMYLNAFFLPGFLTQKSIIYNLLNFISCILLGIGIYFILVSLMRLSTRNRVCLPVLLVLIAFTSIGIASGNKNSAEKNLTQKVNKTAAKPNILFIVVDTLRADSLSCYGYEKIKTPNIDSLAHNGVLFEHAISQAPWTLPSMASLFTSFYPSVHNGEKRRTSKTPNIPSTSYSKINGNITWLPEILKNAGYQAQAFIVNPVLAQSFGFSKGYDEFFNLMYPSTDDKSKKRRAFLWTYLLGTEIISENVFYKTFVAKNENTTITQRTINWLEASKQKPFFLWVHYLDPHFPYERDKIYNLASSYNGRLKDEGFVRTLDKFFIWLGKYNLTTADKNYLKLIYDEEIMFVDEEIGLILKKLKELGIDNNTLIVLTSDHGEEFWEHNYYEHGHSLYQELVHVPMIFYYPKKFPKGLKITSQVRSIDVMPTILEMLSIRHDLNMQGESLLPLIAGEETKDRVAFSESLLYYVERKSIRDGKYSFIFFPDYNKMELYNIQEDPLELNNIVLQNPRLALEFKNKILNWQKDCNEIKESLVHVDSSKDVEFNDDAKQRLKSLGYL